MDVVNRISRRYLMGVRRTIRKSLGGGEMADVIFSGTEGARGQAHQYGRGFNHPRLWTRITSRPPE